ncbi:MAG: PrsW family intramembrane metalloprotease [Methanobacteriota archaeon]|nr:MAG: PrsW family intramembrane metalloprotease [Euryarchaeota archaeon]
MDLGSLALQGSLVTEVAVLVLFAFIPPAIFVIWIRNTERYGREPWGMILGMFIWGAFFAVIIGVILELILSIPLQVNSPVEDFIARRFPDTDAFAVVFVALVIAPFVEEFAKAYGVLRRQAVIREPEDGYVYGATSGLGFSATENLIYGAFTFVLLGFIPSLVQIAIRSISSSLLHASATSVTGYGIARHRLWGPRFSAAPWYLAAVAMHAAFNGIAVVGSSIAQAYGDVGQLLLLAAAVVFSFLAISIVRGKIMEHDARQGWVP